MGNKEVFEKAIKQFGVLHRLDLVIEECAELIQAINKAKRSGIVKEWGISAPSQECDMESINAYNNLCSEFADVKIMLAQLELMLRPDFVQISYERKIKRLEKLLIEPETKANDVAVGKWFKCIKTSENGMVTENLWYQCTSTTNPVNPYLWFKNNNGRPCSFVGHHIHDFFDLNNPKDAKPN
jgi:NTP pyrophosphatase (non-canonical NTP hydrolase)